MKKLLWLSVLSVLATANVNAEQLMSNNGNPACGIVEGPVFEVPAQTIQCPSCPKCDQYILIPEKVEVIPATFSAERVEVVPASLQKVCPTAHAQRCHTRCHKCHRAKAACGACQRRVHEARTRGGYEIVEGIEPMAS